MFCWGWHWCALESIWSRILAHKEIVSLATIGTLWGTSKKAFRWYLDKHDGKVLALMTDAARNARLDHPTMSIALLPTNIVDLATAVRRTQESTRKSLRRLEAAGKVREVKHGEWCLAK